MKSQINFLFQQAIQSFESNNFDRAKSMLIRIINEDKNHFDAVHLIGVILGIENNHEEAIIYFKKAWEINPNNYFINFNLGKALSEIGKNEQALHYHSIAIKNESNNPEAFLHFGKSLLELNQISEAINKFTRAIELRQDFAEAYYNKGLALSKINNIRDAIFYFDKAIKFEPSLAEAWFRKGLGLNEIKLYDEALVNLNRAIELNPNYIDAWFCRGHVLYELNKLNDAVAQFSKVIELKPDSAEGYSDRGFLFNVLNEYDMALADFNTAIKLNPNMFEAWSNRGVALNRLMLQDEALKSFNKALEINPNHSEAWSNKGSFLSDQGLYEEAFTCFEKAITLNFNNNDAHSSRAVLNLYTKQYKLGWSEYDFRVQTKSKYLQESVKNLKIWNGIDECNKLVVLSEQGIGDSLFFSSLLPILKNRIKEVTVSVDKKIIPIFSRSFTNINFIDQALPINYSSFDAQIKFGSLPVVLDMHPRMIGRNVPYILDDESLTLNVKNILSDNKKIKVGIAWKSINPKIGRNKSVSLLEMSKFLKSNNCEFINLQYGDTELELKDLNDNFGIKIRSIDNINLYENINGVLSIIKACDLVITTSNITAHLAGAIGKRTLLLTPYAAGRIWYWHDEKVNSWYPSISLHVQNKNNEWFDAIEEVAYELKNQLNIINN